MNSKTILVSAMTLALMAAGVAQAKHHKEKEDDEHEMEFTAELMPLNGSGVYAEVELELEGDMLEVEIEASGFEPGQVHPQHIHGLADMSANATCPDLSADVDGDGIINVREGLPNYGPIVLPLSPFNLVDAEGNLKYEAKFKVDLTSLGDLTKRTIVLHGMTINGTYVPSTPVACGQIMLDD